MADINNCLTLGCQLTDHLEQDTDLIICQRRSRLIHDDDFCIECDRTYDLNHLLLCNRQLTHSRVWIKLNAIFRKDTVYLSEILFPIDDPGKVCVFSRNIKIGLNGHIRIVVQLLMDHRNAFFHGIKGVGDLYLFSFDQDISSFLFIDTGKHLHQCGLSSTIFAAERMDRSGLHAKGHIIQSFYTREDLCNAPHFKQILRAHLHFPFLFLPFSRIPITRSTLGS